MPPNLDGDRDLRGRRSPPGRLRESGTPQRKPASGRSERDAAELVQAAASQTSRGAESIELRASSPGGGGYTSAGLIELRGGRFAVDLTAPDAGAGRAPDGAVGVDGEGFENTVAVLEEGFTPSMDGPCWLNPHAPVGSGLGTVSVEESMRLTGAIAESIEAGELRSVEVRRNGAFAVVLAASATRPRGAFKETERRIWGARERLRKLAAPVRVTLSGDGDLERIEFRFEPFRERAFDVKGRAIGEARVDVSLTPSDVPLKLDEPECQAIE